MAQFLRLAVSPIVESGTTSATTTNKLREAGQNFLTTVSIGDIVYNSTDGAYAKVTAVDSDIALTLDADIIPSGKAYVIYSKTASTKQLISSRNVLLVEQTDNNNVTINYSSSSTGADVMTINHYTQASGTAMRDAIQDALVAAHDSKTVPDVYIDVDVTSTVLGIAIG